MCPQDPWHSSWPLGLEAPCPGSHVWLPCDLRASQVCWGTPWLSRLTSGRATYSLRIPSCWKQIISSPPGLLQISGHRDRQQRGTITQLGGARHSVPCPLLFACVRPEAASPLSQGSGLAATGKMT